MQIRKLIVAAGMSLIFVSTYSAARSEDAAASTLEDPESVSLKKVCRSYARICARYPLLARLSGRNTKNRDRSVKCHAGKDFSEFRLDAKVVKNVLGQLTESRSPNEDSL